MNPLNSCCVITIINNLCIDFIGGGIMTETGRIGIGASLGLVQGVDLSTNPDRGHVLVHAQKGSFLID